MVCYILQNSRIDRLQKRGDLFKMATSNANNNGRHSLLPEIGPDGLPRESSVISYTEKIIEEEQLQLRKDLTLIFLDQHLGVQLVLQLLETTRLLLQMLVIRGV